MIASTPYTIQPFPTFDNKPMKPFQKFALACLLIAGTLSVLLGIYYRSEKWIESAGLIFDIAGVVQLEISGLFEHWLEKYGDVKKYPSGPPSHITRQVIDNPDSPVRMWLRDMIFYDRRTGFWLLVLGFLFQLVADWFVKFF